MLSSRLKNKWKGEYTIDRRYTAVTTTNNSSRNEQQQKKKDNEIQTYDKLRKIRSIRAQEYRARVNTQITYKN